MEVNTKSLEKSANPRHMILFKMFQTISFYSFLFSIRGNDSEQCQNIPSIEKYKNNMTIELTTSINTFSFLNDHIYLLFIENVFI